MSKDLEHKSGLFVNFEIMKDLMKNVYLHRTDILESFRKIRF